MHMHFSNFDFFSMQTFERDALNLIDSIYVSMYILTRRTGWDRTEWQPWFDLRYESATKFPKSRMQVVLDSSLYVAS